MMGNYRASSIKHLSVGYVSSFKVHWMHGYGEIIINTEIQCKCNAGHTMPTYIVFIIIWLEVDGDGDTWYQKKKETEKSIERRFSWP